jgi:hypothetical protein
MNLPLIKYHIKELCKLLEPEPNSTVFGRLHVELETLLNSLPLKNIKEERSVPISDVQTERK